jgi:S-DNA-T family DNA segregation ATPase FtsK/SpoIIIE
VTVRITTGALLGVLADLVQTADGGPDGGVMGAVLLYSTRGHHGAEPGAIELLAGVSSDRYTAGHTYTPCSGQLGAPTLWSLRDVRAVLSVFKAARGKDAHNAHAVEIRRSGGEIVIREDPNLIDEGVSLSFGELDAAEYPAPALYRLLDAAQPSVRVSVQDGRPVTVHATPRTDLPPSRLRGFSAVARRRGELLQLYRSHQHVPVLVQVGGTYRGVLLPWRPVDTAGDEQAPDAELYPPDLDHPRWHRGGDQADEQRDEQRPAPWQQLLLEELDADVTGGAPTDP